MNRFTTFWAVATRLLLGWFMIFDALPMVTDPTFSAAGFLTSAKTFPAFYAWFAQPGNLIWVNPLNEWGIMAIGVAFFLGVFMRPAAIAAFVMMFVYYFPHYVFPTVPHGIFVEEHIVYAAAFMLVGFMPQAQRFGLGDMLKKSSLGRMPIIGSLI